MLGPLNGAGTSPSSQPLIPSVERDQPSKSVDASVESSMGSGDKASNQCFLQLSAIS